MKKLIPLILLATIVLAGCSISESRKMKNPLATAADGQPPADDQSDLPHYSVTGVLFTADNTHRYFKIGYRDPKGLIWGTVMRPTHKQNNGAPEAFCTALAARLPTCDELQRLATALGRGSREGFSLYTRDDSSVPVIGELFRDRFKASYQGDSNTLLSSAPYCEFSYAQEGSSSNGGSVQSIQAELATLDHIPNLICVIEAKNAVTN